MSEIFKRAVSETIEEIWNNGNLSVLDKLIDPNYVAHTPNGDEIRGVEGLKASIAGFKAAFPDAKMEILSQVAENNQVVTTLRMKGTHTGNLKLAGGGAIAATNTVVDPTGTSRVRFSDSGKIVEEWVQWDELGTLDKIGAINTVTSSMARPDGLIKIQH